jgi:hypothetical protein
MMMSSPTLPHDDVDPDTRSLALDWFGLEAKDWPAVGVLQIGEVQAEDK